MAFAFWLLMQAALIIGEGGTNVVCTGESRSNIRGESGTNVSIIIGESGTN